MSLTEFAEHCPRAATVDWRRAGEERNGQTGRAVLDGETENCRRRKLGVSCPRSVCP